MDINWLLETFRQGSSKVEKTAPAIKSSIKNVIIEKRTNLFKVQLISLLTFAEWVRYTKSF